MSFHVGQKVACVDDSTGNSLMGMWFPGSEIFKYKIYEVRNVGLTRGHTPGIRLVGVILNNESGADLFYRSSRFRPIVERKTDISMFKAMLTDSKVTA